MLQLSSSLSDGSWRRLFSFRSKAYVSLGYICMRDKHKEAVLAALGGKDVSSGYLLRQSLLLSSQEPLSALGRKNDTLWHSVAAP